MTAPTEARPLNPAHLPADGALARPTIPQMEPALIRGAVLAVLGVLASLGFTIGGETTGALVGVCVAAVTLGQALWTRRAVYSPAAAAVLLAAAPPTGAEADAAEADGTTYAVDTSSSDREWPPPLDDEDHPLLPPAA